MKQLIKVQLINILIVLTLITVLRVAVGQAPASDQQHSIVLTWNAVGDSYSRENLAIDGLTKSLQMNPPWRVLDAQAPRLRAEMIDKIIREHEQRIRLLKKLKQLDSN